MPLTEAGRDFLAQALMNDAPTFFTNANAYLGVGDGDDAFAASQTDLQAATNKLRRAMEATYPQRTDNVLTFRSVFGTGDANWRWEEWGTFNGSSGGVMLNRVAEFLGEKTNAATWQLTVELTIEIGS